MSRMDSQALLKSIRKSFYENESSNSTYLSLSENLMKVCREISDSGEIEINLKNETAPLAPFLNILEKLDVPDGILKESVYGLQYETFKSFLKDGFPAERKDAVILEEIDYEQKKIREAVISILEKCFSGKAVIYNAQKISDDALKILEEIEDSEIKGKFIFCFNSFETEKISPALKHFTQRIFKQENYFVLSGQEDFSESDFSSEEERGSRHDFQKIFEVLKSYRSFLDIKRAYELVKKIDSLDILHEANPEDARKIYLEMGIIAFYFGDTDSASFYFSSIAEHQADDLCDCYAFYYLAYVSSKKNMNSVALKYILKAISKAKKFQDEPVYALSVMMEYIITERTDSQYSTTKYFQALNLLEKLGLKNNRIYTSLIIPYGIVYEKSLREEMLVQVEKSKDEAEKIGNNFGLSIACHWMGILLTHEDKKEEALKWYTKCFKFREEMGDFSSLIKVINGLSYEYMVGSDYKESYNLVNKVIKNLLEIKDYPEIIITLYNLSRTCFYSRNFEIASDLFQTISNLLVTFEISDLCMNSFLPEANDIVAYKAALEFFRGEFTHAKMNLHNMQNNGKAFMPIEEIVKFFLESLVSLEEGNKDEATRIFDKCVEDFFSIGVTQEHRIVFMFYEFAALLFKKGFEKESREYFSRGFKIASEKNLVNFTKGKSSLTLEEYLSGVEKFEPLKISLSSLEEKAEKEQLVNQLHKKLRDSQFLNKLSSSHAKDFSDSRFSLNIVQSVFDYTLADAVFLSEKKDGKWQILSQSVRENIKKPLKPVWEKLSRQKKIVEVKKRFEIKQKFEAKSGTENAKAKEDDSESGRRAEDERQIVFINLSRFEFVGGMIIYLQKRLSLSSEELNILNIAAANIQAQIVMLKQNEHLAIISATDQLSMLNNRRALHNHLSLESEMIRRYEKKRNMYMHDAISFLDLDNFKYYNDTFGHEAGDLLISAFANLMKSVYRKVDFIARFGGDEFVVVLPNTNCQEAARAAERLYEALTLKEFFIPELEKMLGKKLVIPENRRLGFSMGIAANSDEEDISDLDTTMINADKALYFSKQNRKGTVTIWSDIKDKIDGTKLPCKER